MSIRVDFSDLNSGLDAFADKANDSIRVYAVTAADKMEGHAQATAPWTDQTGNARKSIRGFVEEYPDKSITRVGVEIGVDYGIFLELGHEKRFAVLAPTINNYSQEIFNGFSRLLDGLK